MQVNDLPTYPELRDVEITDFHHVVPLVREHKPSISDYNFTNIFAWRHAYEHKIAQLDGMIVIRGHCVDGFFIHPPIGSAKKTAEAVRKIFKLSEGSKERPFLAFTPDWLVEELKDDPHVKIISDRNNWDYVYKSSDLAELPGAKYHPKRNLIRQFESRYDAKIEELDTATCLEAIEFSDRWCEQRDCESNEGLEKEKCAIFQMLSHFEALRLHGILVRVNGEIHGLTMGEELNPDTYVIHVEKGDQHHRGIYQFINQQLATRVANKYKWTNREQDLGINGLRRAKTSYYPDHFIKKWRVKYTR